MLHTIIIRETGSDKPKRIGRYDDVNNVFFTSRVASKHLLRNQNAWAIDFKLFNDILLPKNALISIKERKTGVIYNARAIVFKEHGEEVEYLNHRKQICLNLEYFTKEKIQ